MTTNKKKKECSQLITYDEYIHRKKSKDTFFYAKDIKYTLTKNNIYHKGTVKTTQLKLLDELYTKLHHYNTHKEKIVLIQKTFREYIRNKKYKYTGINSKELCINKEDFYTFETIDEIDPIYFFSFKDTRNKMFFFDIRSLKKLIENDQNNPFTTEPIPELAIKNMKKRLKLLKKMNYKTEFEKEILTPEQEYNSRVLSIFQKLDSLNINASGTNPDWFHNLNFKQLIKLYAVLEDVWNYRSQLNYIQKKEIIKDEKMFLIHPNRIVNFPENIKNKRKIQTIILKEIDKLISTSDDINHKCTGGYYVLISFTEISHQCAEEMPWLIQHI